MSAGDGAFEAAPLEDEVRPRVQSAARAISILLAVARSDGGLSTREISEQVGIGRQATYHLVHTLVSTRMLTRNDQHRYLLGLRVGTLAAGFSRQLAPAEHLSPLVRTLARDTGESSYASGWWGGQTMTMAFAPGTNAVRAAEVPQGQAGDAHARASGKLLLAMATPAALDDYLRDHALAARTPQTITTRPALEAELATIRQARYAVDDEEYAEGLYCMAVPIDDGLSPFVLALSGPRDRVIGHRGQYLAAMRRVADGALRSPGPTTQFE